jgi:hypothetical protein
VCVRARECVCVRVCSYGNNIRMKHLGLRIERGLM